MASMQELIGQTLGQYKIIERIGEGGMATIFKAYQPGLNREVALKILPPYVAEKEGFAERFTREAQAIGNLHHPNILPVYDSGRDKGYGYLAMRYVPRATTLAHLMKAPLPTDRILEITGQVAAALEHAHKAGVIHRDIKPSNILMDNDWVLLSDFGLAKMVETPSELTGTGVGLGTPAYMSPEQAKGQKIDHRTDIYALAIVVFEMLTGHVPHKAETPLATVVKRINEPMPLPRSLNPDIPVTVERVLLKALAMNPADRYDSAGAFAAGLEDAFADASSQAAVGRNLAVPQPAEQLQPAKAGPIAAVSKSTALAPVEIVALTLLGLVSLCGVGGILLSFTTSQETGQSNIALLPACSGMTFAGLTSMLMIWIRNKTRPASAWLAMAIVSWFVGANILGWGGFAALSPGNDNTFLENLGYSLILCFAPGGVLSLVGLAFYIHDYRQNRGAAPATTAQPATETVEKQRRLAKLERAAEYRQHILAVIKQRKGSRLQSQLDPIVDKLDRWQRHLQKLVSRIDQFEDNHIIQRDLQEVPKAISRLKQQQKSEPDEAVRREIGETLAKHEEQQRQLNLLVGLMRRTELDIDETLAAMGSIYSQLQILGAKDVDSHRARRLSAEINEQAEHLEDLLSAMDEVYQSSPGLQ